MKNIKSQFRVKVALLMFPLCLVISMYFCLQALAADYPERAITLVVPYPPGGVTDLAARTFADAMEKELKKPFVVVNKAGGATTIGGNAVATAKPDGYILGFFPPSASIPEVFTYFYQAPYSSKDLKPACSIAGVVGAIVVKDDSPINSFKDLVEYLQKNPGTKYGINGKTSNNYITIKGVAKAENIKITDVSFEGDVKIVVAILGGHIPVGSPTYPSIKSQVAAKQLKLLALITDKRAEFMPNVPTIVELGYKVPRQELSVFAPKGTPDDIVKKLDNAAARVSQEPAFRSKLMALGIVPSYANTKSLEISIEEGKMELQSFFREEGLVK